MADEIFTYFVSGKLYVREYGETSAFEWPGLVDTVNLAIAEQVIDLPDRTQPGGGIYDQVRRIQNVTVTINHREFRPALLARALFGENTSVAGAAVTNEEHEATLGGFIFLDHPGPYTGVNISTSSSPGVPITADGNYTVEPGGIAIDADSPDIDEGETLLIDYTHPAYVRTQAIRTAAPEVEIVFVGENEARDEKEVRVRLHKVRLGAAAEQALLSGDDFGALQLTGEVLKDTTIVGAGLSQYFYEDQVT
jgi:hypothetical protein